MEHSNSRTFQGLSRTYSVFKDFQGPGIFFSKFKDFQGLLKDPMNPVGNDLVAGHIMRLIRYFVQSQITDDYSQYTDNSSTDFYEFDGYQSSA